MNLGEINKYYASRREPGCHHSLTLGLAPRCRSLNMKRFAAPLWGLEGELCMLVRSGFKYSASLHNTLHGPLSMETQSGG